MGVVAKRKGAVGEKKESGGEIESCHCFVGGSVAYRRYRAKVDEGLFFERGEERIGGELDSG